MVTLYSTSSTNDLSHSGRPRDTTARQDMYICLQHIYTRFTRATTDNWQPPISDEIVRRRFITNTTRYRCPTGGPILTVRHRQERLQWNIIRQNWRH
jgi:Asp/Glu/hydantoin racemase